MWRGALPLVLCGLLAACGGSLVGASSTRHSPPTTSGVIVSQVTAEAEAGSGNTPVPSLAFPGPEALSANLSTVESFFGHQGFGSWRNAASEASGVSDLVAAAGDCRTFISGPKGTTQVGLIGVSCSMSKSTTEAKGGSLLVAMIQKFVPTAASWMHRSIVGTQTSPYVTSSVDLQYLAASGISNLVIQARGFT